MVEDSQIKAEVSPFAIREGEIKVFDGKDGYVSMNQIINKINLGHITDIHFKILEIVNEFEFITSRQIYQLLQIKGIEIKSQDKLNKKLEQLIKTKILTRYYFHSEDGKGIYRIYCLEKMGKYLLNSRDIECKWQPTDNVKPVALIKKRLAGNQTLLAYLRKVKAFDSYVVKPQLTAKTLAKPFKASGGSVKLTKNNKSISFLFEVVRREEDWKNKLVEKMRLYQDFYDNFVPGDSGFPIMPQLIFVCEDEKHTAETFKLIVTKGLEISKIKLYFTTDLRQNKESLEDTLIEFKLDENTNKYKVANVELKLLED
jgi:arginine repressor